MMLLIVFAAITALFGLWLGVNSLAKSKVCAICLSVSTTWIGLLVAHRAGLFEDQTLLALLMGQSVVGVYYLFEKKAPREWLVFRLPMLLTLTFAAYTVITWQLQVLAALFLAGAWLVFGAVFSLQNAPRVKHAAKKLIECCGNW